MFLSDFYLCSGMSHSAFSDMKTLHVEEPVEKDLYMYDRSDEDDFFERFTSIP